MALICSTLTSTSKSAPIPSTSCSYASPPSPSAFGRRFLVPAPLLAPPLGTTTTTIVVNYNSSISRTQRHVVRMAPDEEKLTRRNPLDFPIEWDKPRPGRRPDIFPQFSPMKTPLPPPMPFDPPEEDDEEAEENKEEEEDPEKEETEKPDE